MHEDEHASFDGLRHAALVDLAWLEHRVAVRQHHRRPHRLQVLDDVDRLRIQPRAEVPLHQHFARMPHDVRVLRVLLLESPECLVEVDDVQVVAHDFVKPPELLRQALAQDLPELHFHVCLDAVVVEEGVVQVDQEDELPHG